MSTPEFPAAFTVATPSGSTNACREHAYTLQALFGRVWGMQLSMVPSPEGSQCDNCINEAKATGAAP